MSDKKRTHWSFWAILALIIGFTAVSALVLRYEQSLQEEEQKKQEQRYKQQDTNVIPLLPRAEAKKE